MPLCIATCSCQVVWEDENLFIVRPPMEGEALTSDVLACGSVHPCLEGETELLCTEPYVGPCTGARGLHQSVHAHRRPAF